MRWRDPLGLKITEIDPSLQPFLDCALTFDKTPFFQIAWDYFDKNPNTDWKLLSLSRVKTHTQGGMTTPLGDPERPGPGFPDCDQGGMFFANDVNPVEYKQRGNLIPPENQDCHAIVESIVHEILEAYAYCYAGLGKGGFGTSAHRIVEPTGSPDSGFGVDDAIAYSTCTGCRCKEILGR